MHAALSLLALLLLPAPAAAQASAEEVAERAQEVHEQQCAAAAGADEESDAALALADVVAIWAEVARVHEATGATWLLYWRGVLAQCIGQDERAAEALKEFVESDTASAGMAAMVRDARKRLGHLQPDDAAQRPRRPPPSFDARPRAGRVAGGLALAFGAAGAGLGSGLGFGQLSITHGALTTTLLPPAESEALIGQGDGQLVAGVGLAVGAGVAAVASIATFASRSSRAPEVAVLPVRLAGGLGVGVAWRW